MSTATSSHEASGTERRPLVVGVGSLVRGDDAIGRLVAERFARLDRSGSTVRVVTQLVPELVEDMADASAIVFIDADHAADRPSVRTVRRADVGPLTHHGTPESLCRLAEVAFGTCPPAAVIGMPARSFDVGADPSPWALGFVAEAAGLVAEVIRDIARSPSHMPLPRRPGSM